MPSETLQPLLRRLRRDPGWTVAVVSTIAVGLAAVTAIYAVVDAVLLRPLPFPDSERVVILCETAERVRGYCVASPPNAADWARESRALDAVGVARSWSFHLRRDGAPTSVRGGIATAGFFDVLGARPALGRLLADEDLVAGGERVALLRHGYWLSAFGGDVDVVGTTLEIDGAAVTVVGVLAAETWIPEYDWIDLWMPLTATQDDVTNRGWRGFTVLARLAPEVSLDQARRELALVRDQLAAAHPDTNRDWGLRLEPLRAQLVGSARVTLLLLLAAVTLLLLIACVNVALLLLARLTRRGGELAVRAALGADRRRLAGLVVGESLLLAGGGALASAALTWLALAAFRALAPPGLPRLDGVAIDGQTALFALGLALATGFAVSLLAARQALRGDLAEVLRAGRGRLAGTRRRRGLLVAIEMATAVVLLVGAGLMVRTLSSLLAIDPGFRPDGAFTLRLQLPASDYPQPADVAAFVDRARERLAALPGVEAAGALRILPLATSIGDRGVDVEGRPPAPGEATAADWQVITPGTVEALGMRLVAGRPLGDGERFEGGPSVLVNEAFVRRYWPGLDPIGRRFRLFEDDAPWATVVGVVADLRHNDLLQPVKPSFFWPHAQFASSTGFTSRAMTFVLRTAGEPMALAGPARAVLAELDPRLPVADLRPLAEATSVATAPSRFAAGILLALSGLALVLASVGVYGVLARTVAQRTRELGLRAALGARPRELVLGVAREGLAASLLGLAAGLLAAAALARFLAGLVHGVSVHDLATFTAAPLLLLAVAAVACLVPAWRASRVDAATALRAE